MWRVPVGGCHLPGKDHLIRADEGPCGREIVPRRRVTKHKVPTLRQLDVDQTAGDIERVPDVIVLPEHGQIRGPRLGPEDRVTPVDPARRDVEAIGLRIEIVHGLARREHCLWIAR